MILSTAARGAASCGAWTAFNASLSARSNASLPAALRGNQRVELRGMQPLRDRLVDARAQRVDLGACGIGHRRDACAVGMREPRRRRQIDVERIEPAVVAPYFRYSSPMSRRAFSRTSCARLAKRRHRRQHRCARVGRQRRLDRTAVRAIGFTRRRDGRHEGARELRLVLFEPEPRRGDRRERKRQRRRRSLHKPHGRRRMGSSRSLSIWLRVTCSLLLRGRGARGTRGARVRTRPRSIAASGNPMMAARKRNGIATTT